MSRPLLFVLVALVAADCAQARGGGGGRRPPPPSGGSSVCQTTLAPTSAEHTQLQAAMTTCIAEQDGLQAIIDGLMPSRLRRHGGGGGGQRADIAALLESNGYTTEATALRECIAGEMGWLAADGTFDMDAFKATITAKISGSTVEANTQLGLNNCPAVDDYDVPEYMKCVMTWCETGAAPTTTG